MFDKRLMKMCPESRRYIFGNIVLQWLELLMNAVMIGLIALSVEQLWQKDLTKKRRTVATYPDFHNDRCPVVRDKGRDTHELSGFTHGETGHA